MKCKEMIFLSENFLISVLEFREEFLCLSIIFTIIDACTISIMVELLSAVLASVRLTGFKSPVLFLIRSLEWRGVCFQKASVAK